MEPRDRSPWHFRDLQASGANTLGKGLSHLPTEFTSSSTTPLAYWKSENFGFVIFLAGSPTPEGELAIWTGSYDRKNDEWIPNSGAWFGRQVTREEVEGPWEPPVETMEDNVLRLGGGVIRGPDEEGPSLIMWGWCNSTLAQVSLVHVQDRISVPVGHLGSWVIGSQSADPWTIEAYDSSGLVGTIEGPRPSATLIEVIHVPEADWPHSSSGQFEMLTLKRYEDSVKVEWKFSFRGDTEALLTTESKSRLQEHVRAKSFDSAAERDEFLEHWRRFSFLLQLTIADDLGTEYVYKGGGGSPSGAVAHWDTRFQPPIPEGASFLIVCNRDMEIHVPLHS